MNKARQFDGLVQGCSNSSALSIELLQSGMKPMLVVPYIKFDISEI